VSGPNLAKMAWRNIWRNRRRTLVTLSGIVFGVLLAVLFTGLGDATYGKMINLAARIGGGHVSLQHPDALERGEAPKRSITGVANKVRLALADPDVTGARVRITGHTMLGAGGNSRGAGFVAFDPAAEDRSTLSILEAVKSGRSFARSDERGIILGHKLAEHLGVRLGRKVVYTLTDKHGEIVSGLARVRGIIKSGSDSIDSGICLLPIDAVRKVMGYGPDEATRVAVFIKDQRKSDRVAARVGGRLDRGAVAVTWFERQPELAGFISMKVTSTLFFELIIAILVAAGIFNTLFVSVMERLREFGIMMAIGFSPWRLFRLVMWESLWVALVGVVLATAATAWPYHYLNTKGIDMSAMVSKGGAEVAGIAVDPVMYVAIYPENALFIAGAAVVATLLAGLYPAWRAGRVVPVDSIKLV
jgi:ABC-type lipoprotein release transport system permease subunit